MVTKGCFPGSVGSTSCTFKQQPAFLFVEFVFTCVRVLHPCEFNSFSLPTIIYSLVLMMFTGNILAVFIFKWSQSLPSAYANAWGTGWELIGHVSRHGKRKKNCFRGKISEGEKEGDRPPLVVEILAVVAILLPPLTSSQCSLQVHPRWPRSTNIPGRTPACHHGRGLSVPSFPTRWTPHRLAWKRYFHR